MAPRAQRARTTRSARPPAPAGLPIVGIGASAGGLEALEVFLQNVPPGAGVAIVIIQHLDPTHEALLAELLQRVTPMTVTEVSDGLAVAPDCVYVIPPNADLVLTGGVLRLTVPTSARGLRLPIDHFFASLAGHAPAAGVILSGMGTDGTIGLTAIKAHGGGTFVQEPATAKFSGMPDSAVAAGVADVVAPVAALPGRILDYLRSGPHGTPGATLAADGDETLDDVLGIVKERTGRDFTQYKQQTVGRRLKRRMDLHKIVETGAYARFLRENPHEVELLSKELLIGVTSFFRDPAAWDALKEWIAASVAARCAPRQALRAWVAGCSTGEEAYSLAIVCREVLDALAPGPRPAIQIFATDLSTDAVERARTGRYPATIAADVPAERLERFFVKAEDDFQVSKSIRETVIFAPHDVTTDPPFSKLDVLICRNLLIYLTPSAQQQLLPRFHHGLRPGGVLLLGSAETIGAGTSLFTPLDLKARLYQRLDSSIHTPAVAFHTVTPAQPPADRRPTATPDASSGSLADAAHQLLGRYAPASVLVTAAGDIIFISGRTGDYLEPVAGKANWNLFDMARDGLRQELGAGFRMATKCRQAVTRRQVRVSTARGARTIDVTVHPIDEPGVLHGLLAVVFRPVTPPAADPAAVPRPRPAGAATTAATTLRRQLSAAEREKRTLRSERQIAVEAMASTNEELQSANEELQSTNEELTTSREEMQSMNEELQTLNQELQARVDSLSRLTNDMKNLLDNTDLATIFLDLELRVRLFTAGSSRVFHLVAGDVGRPITDFASTLDYPTLAGDAREVLRTLAVHQQRAATTDGRWIQVRLMPYRTLDNLIDGVTITFADVTASTMLEMQLRATQAGLEQHIEAQSRQIEDAERPAPAPPFSPQGPSDA